MTDIEQIKKYAENISGQWNGDEPGLQEDRAGIANEILEKISEIEELLKEL
jgi:hypothetical protein